MVEFENQKEVYQDIRYEIKILSYILRVSFDKKIYLKTKYFTKFFTQTICDAIVLNKSISKDVIIRYCKEIFKDDYVDFKGQIKQLYSLKLNDMDDQLFFTMIEKLIEMWKKREVIDLIIDVSSDLDNVDINSIYQDVEGIVKEQPLVSRVDSGDVLEDYEERKEKLLEKIELVKQSKDGIAGITTGIKQLDQHTGGWMSDDLAVFVGYTGTGKSIFLNYFGFSAWKSGKNVILVSLEMKKHSIQHRTDSMFARINNRVFRKGEITERELKRWDDAVNYYRDRINSYYEVAYVPRGTTVSEVANVCRDIQDRRKEQVDLIIVDYLNILSPTGNQEKRKEALSQYGIAEELKSVSNDFFGYGKGIPILTANQMTDEGSKRTGRGEKSDIKYSRGIAEVVSMIYIIRQSYEDEINNEIELESVKIRDLELLPKMKLFSNYAFMLPIDYIKYNKRKNLLKNEQKIYL